MLGLEAIYRKPRTSVADSEHGVYRYVLRCLTLEQPNQVGGADITYISVEVGFVYLLVIMDWGSQRVLSWSNTIDTEFRLAAFAAAFECYGIPEIVNTDQGSKFTSTAFAGLLETARLRCSMDGRGRCLRNVLIERLRRSLEYGAVYLHDREDGFEAQRRSAGGWSSRTSNDRTRGWPVARLRKRTVTGVAERGEEVA